MSDGTGTIATGGTAQPLLPNAGSREGFWVQNTSSGDLRISRDGAASSTAGLLLPPGALYESPAGMPVSGAISVWGATTGQTYSMGEW